MNFLTLWITEGTSFYRTPLTFECQWYFWQHHQVARTFQIEIVINDEEHRHYQGLPPTEFDVRNIRCKYGLNLQTVFQGRFTCIAKILYVMSNFTLNCTTNNNFIVKTYHNFDCIRFFLSLADFRRNAAPSVIFQGTERPGCCVEPVDHI